MDTKQLIGLRIKELRRTKNLSQEELAEKTGISSKYLSSIERGKENPTLDTIIKLSGALNIEVMELFNFFHKGRATKDLRLFVNNLLKGSDESRLALTAKIIKAIYL